MAELYWPMVYIQERVHLSYPEHISLLSLRFMIQSLVIGKSEPAPTVVWKERVWYVGVQLGTTMELMPCASGGGDAWIKQCGILWKQPLVLHFQPKGHRVCLLGPWCGWGDASHVLAPAPAVDGLWEVRCFLLLGLSDDCCVWVIWKLGKWFKAWCVYLTKYLMAYH